MLRYADDIAIIAESEEELQGIIEAMEDIMGSE